MLMKYKTMVNGQLKLCNLTNLLSLIVMQSKNIISSNIYSWCGPCRKLTPLLEELTIKHEGKFKLVKLNIDNLPQIASGLKV